MNNRFKRQIGKIYIQHNGNNLETADGVAIGEYSALGFYELEKFRCLNDADPVVGSEIPSTSVDWVLLIVTSSHLFGFVLQRPLERAGVIDHAGDRLVFRLVEPGRRHLLECGECVADLRKRLFANLEV
jgi:hypothetical protein